MTQQNEKLREAARFLCQRLREFEQNEDINDFHGKRLPALANLEVLLSEPLSQWQAHEPVEGAVAPEGAVWALMRRGKVLRADAVSTFGPFTFDPEQEIIAFCTSAEPPQRDAEGYYSHDGSVVAPVSGGAEIVFEMASFHAKQFTKLLKWPSVARWRPVGGEHV